MQNKALKLPWIKPGQAFPAPALAWGPDSDAPGLLAAGGSLSVKSLQNAYAQGIFPWFSAGQPVLWWAPSPRMVLPVAHFKLHRSLRKTIARFCNTPGCEVRLDTAFARVIAACASSPREPGERLAPPKTPEAANSATWIQPEMITAYNALHQAGLAHSVETWVHGQLVGGLYLVNLGRMVFGESMFSHQADASKIALAALVAFCRVQHMPLIDCQQNTRHLRSLGASEIPREAFMAQVKALLQSDPLANPAPQWSAGPMEPLYWQKILGSNLSLLSSSLPVQAP